MTAKIEISNKYVDQTLLADSGKLIGHGFALFASKGHEGFARVNAANLGG